MLKHIVSVTGDTIAAFTVVNRQGAVADQPGPSHILRFGEVPFVGSHILPWEAIAQSTIDEYRSRRQRSIILIGYSTGGRSVLEMAAYLNTAKVPVQLVVIIDGSSGPPVAPNIRKLVNFYVFNGYGGPITRQTNFRGSLENIPVKDSNVGHFSIIDAKERQLLSYVMSAARSGL